MNADWPCREVLALRTFAPAEERQRTSRRLLRKYIDGRRSAADLVQGLAALLAQLQHREASRLLGQALDGVRPVPTLLWDWACRHLRWQTTHTLHRMLYLSTTDRRLARRLEPVRDRVADTLEGVLALLNESHRIEWVRPLLRRRFGPHLQPDREGPAPADRERDQPQLT